MLNTFNQFSSNPLLVGLEVVGPVVHDGGKFDTVGHIASDAF
jgi:hypothetical protein